MDNLYYVFLDTSWSGRESPNSFHEELLSASLKHLSPFTIWAGNKTLIYLLINKSAFVLLMYFPFYLSTKDTANLQF